MSESDTVVNAADASTEAVFVRFWLRENLVTPGGEDVPGTGLLISEAQNGSFTQSTNSANTILYITIDTTYFNDTGVENLQVEVTNPDGTIAQTLSLNTDFQHETGLAVTGEVFLYNWGTRRYVFYDTLRTKLFVFIELQPNDILQLRRHLQLPLIRILMIWLKVGYLQKCKQNLIGLRIYLRMFNLN